jgi:hypothetical protein
MNSEISKEIVKSIRNARRYPGISKAIVKSIRNARRPNLPGPVPKGGGGMNWPKGGGGMNWPKGGGGRISGLNISNRNYGRPGTINGGLVSNSRNYGRPGTINGGLVSNSRNYGRPGTINSESGSIRSLNVGSVIRTNTTPRNNGIIPGLSLVGSSTQRAGTINQRVSNVNGFPIGPPTPKKKYPGLGLASLQALLNKTPKRYIKKALSNTLTGKELRELSDLKKKKLTNYMRRRIRPKKKKV